VNGDKRKKIPPFSCVDINITPPVKNAIDGTLMCVMFIALLDYHEA
jgi:hypothetical protein